MLAENSKQIFRHIIPDSLSFWLREKRKRYHAKILYANEDMFTLASLETYSFCDRVCHYCPNSIKDLKQERTLNLNRMMPDGIYKSIIEQLAEFNYQSKLSFGQFGETLLDVKLEEKISYAKEKLPSSWITIYTNGDYLTVERFKSLVDAGVDSICVTNHNQNNIPHEKLDTLVKFLTSDPLYKTSSEWIPYKKFLYVKRLQRSDMANRCVLDLKETRGGVIGRCTKSYSLTVNASGHVIICGHDYLGKIILGKIPDTPILEIWNNEDFREIRKKNRANNTLLKVLLRSNHITSGLIRVDFPTELCKNCIENITKQPY